MSFTQKFKIDKNELKNKLTTLFKEPIEDLELNFMDKGSTGGVFKITINRSLEFVLKRIASFDNIISLNTDVLAPYELNHPEIIGEISLGDNQYILMKLFNNKGNNWGQNDYLLAIDWLAKKDLTMINHLENLRSISYIKSKANYLKNLHDERNNLIKKNASYLFDYDSAGLIKLSKVAIQVLQKEPLTLVHNDYCRNNILISSTSDIRVIDWVESYIGSVTLDLAEILNNAPEMFRLDMRKRYKSITNYDIEALLPYAMINSRLGQITWRIKRILRGDDQFEDVKTEIKYALEECLKISKRDLYIKT